MNKKILSFGILILSIIGLVFISGCVTEDGDRADGQNGNGEEDGGEAEAANWTFEGLCISGEIVDPEVFQLPDGSYAMHIPFAKVAYSSDGLTSWTMSEDKAVGAGISVLEIPGGGYRAWWSIPKGAETFDMLTAFSSDGYNWGEETMLTSSNMEDFYGALPAVVLSLDGTYRMYYTRAGPETYTLPEKDSEAAVRRIYSAHSSDGLFWEPDPGIRIDGAEEIDKGHASSNDVYIREDGKYEMVYCSRGYGIGWAVSNDGLNWTRMGSTGMDGADPVVNVFPDGTIRMYYVVGLKKGDLDKPPGIYSATKESL